MLEGGGAGGRVSSSALVLSREPALAAVALRTRKKSEQPLAGGESVRAHARVCVHCAGTPGDRPASRPTAETVTWAVGIPSSVAQASMIPRRGKHAQDPCCGMPTRQRLRTMPLLRTLLPLIDSVCNVTPRHGPARDRARTSSYSIVSIDKVCSQPTTALCTPVGQGDQGNAWGMLHPPDTSRSLSPSLTLSEAAELHAALDLNALLIEAGGELSVWL